jgi:hypothetical protein
MEQFKFFGEKRIAKIERKEIKKFEYGPWAF